MTSKRKLIGLILVSFFSIVGVFAYKSVEDLVNTYSDSKKIVAYTSYSLGGCYVGLWGDECTAAFNGTVVVGAKNKSINALFSTIKKSNSYNKYKKWAIVPVLVGYGNNNKNKNLKCDDIVSSWLVHQKYLNSEGKFGAAFNYFGCVRNNKLVLTGGAVVRVSQYNGSRYSNNIDFISLAEKKYPFVNNSKVYLDMEEYKSIYGKPAFSFGIVHQNNSLLLEEKSPVIKYYIVGCKEGEKINIYENQTFKVKKVENVGNEAKVSDKEVSVSLSGYKISYDSEKDILTVGTCKSVGSFTVVYKLNK